MLSFLKKIDSNLLIWSGLGRARDFLLLHRALLVYAALVAVLAYPYSLFNFSLNMDSEWHAWSSGGKQGWVDQGRWGMYFLNVYLMPDSVLPFMPPFLAAMGSALGAFFLVHSLSANRGLADWLAIPIAVGCPISFYAFYFTTLGYGVGIAYTCAGLGLYALTRWHAMGCVLAVLCFTFMIAIYQAMLPLIATAFAFYVVATITAPAHYSFNRMLRECLVFIAVLAVSYFLCTLVSTALMKSMGLTFDTHYLGSYIKFQPTLEYVQRAGLQALTLGAGYYTGRPDLYISALPALCALFTVSVAVAALRIIFAAPQSAFVRLLGLCALVAGVLAPFSMLFVSDGTMPPRTLLGVVYALGGLVFVAASGKSQMVRLVLAVLVLACFYKFSVTNTRFALVSEMRWQSDRELTTRLVERIGLLQDKLPAKNRGETWPLAIVGEVPLMRETPFMFVRDRIGESFYAQGGGDQRVIGLWNAQGIFDYFPATPEQYRTITPQLEQMPSWPLAGSVDVVSGVVVVKFDAYTGIQKSLLCVHLKTGPNPFCEQ
jgi:hypothetical protein